MEAFVLVVGVTLLTIFMGIYVGGRRAMKGWGHECPKLWTREKFSIRTKG